MKSKMDLLTVVVGTKISAKHLKLLLAICARQKWTKAQVLRQVITAYLDRQSAAS